MRHTFVIPVIVILFVLAIAGTPIVAAQGATPIPGVDLAPGVTAEVFAGIPSARAPGQTLYVVRITFQPGSDIFPHSHPGTVVFAAESGTFGWTLVEGTAHLVRGAAAGGTPAPRNPGRW